MARLIDANLVLGRLKNNIILGATELAFLRNYVNCCPTVDAVEVVHGYTIPAEEPKKVFLDRKCGICDQLMLSTDVFCPMCGAKMDLEEPSEAKESRQP